MKSFIFLVFATTTALLYHAKDISADLNPPNNDPMMQKSIIYDKKTPDVFYCPLAKPEGLDEMIVKARPLSKLCEHNGNPLPKGYKSDCYNDADETEYACKEKKRILKKLDPPGNEVLEKYKPLTREKRAEMYDLSSKTE